MSNERYSIEEAKAYANLAVATQRLEAMSASKGSELIDMLTASDLLLSALGLFEKTIPESERRSRLAIQAGKHNSGFTRFLNDDSLKELRDYAQRTIDKITYVQGQ